MEIGLKLEMDGCRGNQVTILAYICTGIYVKFNLGAKEEIKQIMQHASY